MTPEREAAEEDYRLARLRVRAAMDESYKAMMLVETLKIRERNLMAERKKEASNEVQA